MRQVNLIFQGGGVKGVAFVGALKALQERNDVEVAGVGGVSAGAIIAALYAAGYTPEEMKSELYEKPLSSLVRAPLMGYLAWPHRLLIANGLYSTKKIYEWVGELLSRRNKKYFNQLGDRLCKIVTANVSDQRLETISNADPQEEIASAVAKSISIPLYFRPYADGERLFVDGGLLSNYPLWLFQDSPLPTVAFKLVSASSPRITRSSWIIPYAFGLVGTMLNAHDKARLGAPSSVLEVPIDASFVRATEFKIEEQRRDLLFANGVAAVGKMKWDSLPEIRSTVFSDPYAAQVLENTASALAKHLTRTTRDKPNSRGYNFYNIEYFVHDDGSADVEEHFQIHNGGPNPISMMESGAAYPADNDLGLSALPKTRETSFLDLKITVQCEEPNEAVVLPTLNSRTEKRFAVAFMPPIAVDGTREVRIKYRLPDVTFRGLIAGNVDSVEVEIAHEQGVKKAAVSVQLESGRISREDEAGDKPVAVKVSPGSTGLQWLFENVPATRWTFAAKFRRSVS